MTLKILYKQEPDEVLDKQIEMALERIGFKWYAQGYNFITGERDVCFEINETQGVPYLSTGEEYTSCGKSVPGSWLDRLWNKLSTTATK